MSQTTPFIGEQRGHEIIEKIRHLDGSWQDVKDDAPPEVKALAVDGKVLFSGAAAMINRLYGILTILDGKANGLLRVNSLFLTVLVFFIGWSHTSSAFPPQLSVYVPLAYIDTIILLASSVLCLLIVAVSWKFLGHVANGKFDAEIARLGNVVDDRTHFFWLAWWGTIGCLILSVIWWLYAAVAL
jgi:hypothetical protein